MISRENQGLQAALVIFVVLTVVAGVVAVAFFNKWDDVQTRLAHAEKAQQSAEGVAEANRSYGDASGHAFRRDRREEDVPIQTFGGGEQKPGDEYASHGVVGAA